MMAETLTSSTFCTKFPALVYPAQSAESHLSQIFGYDFSGAYRFFDCGNNPCLPETLQSHLTPSPPAHSRTDRWATVIGIKMANPLARIGLVLFLAPGMGVGCYPISTTAAFLLLSQAFTSSTGFPLAQEKIGAESLTTPSAMEKPKQA